MKENRKQTEAKVEVNPEENMAKPTWKNLKLSLIDLKPWVRNPRQITTAQAARLLESFEEFGQVQPIVVGPDGEVYDGHQRLAVLKNEFGPGHEVEVWQSNRPLKDYERERLTVLMHQGATGEWNFDELSSFDFEGLIAGGFDVDELYGKEVKPKEAPEARIDEAEALQKQWGTSLGQIWSLGSHRVMCADARHTAAVADLMAGRRARMCHTDPPYNVALGADDNSIHAGREMLGDKQDTLSWMAFCDAFGRAIKKYTSGDVYVWGSSGADGMRMRLALIDLGLHWSATIIWKKNTFVLSRSNYQKEHEPMLYGHFDESSVVTYEEGTYGWFEGKSSWEGGRKQSDVWEFDKPSVNRLHPTMKPIDLCERAILNSSVPGDLVLDLFLGSGSTLIAADRLDRVCYGVELDPKFLAVTIQRWVDMTGGVPVLEG